MTITNLAAFGRDYKGFMQQAILFDDVISVSTENGNAIVISEAAYRSLKETLYLMAHPGTAHEILEGMKEDWSSGKAFDPDEEW